MTVTEFAHGLQAIRNSAKVGANTPGQHTSLRRFHSEVKNPIASYNYTAILKASDVHCMLGISLGMSEIWVCVTSELLKSIIMKLIMSTEGMHS